MSKTFEETMIEKDQRAIAPNIFIGLGGQGCKMVAQLAKKAQEEKSPAKYLAFVAIDTDVNELRKIKTISNKVVTVQTSSRMTIGEYLEYDDNARENWFPINQIILDKTPSEGAGQIRAISNLVAHNAIREGEFTAINDAVDALFPLSADNYEQSIHVTIMGTLAGGTGSGLVLPVALYVKNYIEKIRQQKSGVIRGFFILPDVMDSVISSEVERNNQRSNAYASIREIDALMRRPYDPELQERYPELKVIVPKVGGNGYDEFNNAPFNFCFLFNKINNKGTSIRDKDALLSHAVDCIYDMSVSPICTKVNSQEDNIIREKISSGNKSSYAGAGASRIIYPYDDVVEYVALNWAKGSISNKWLDADKHVIKAKDDNNKALNRGAIVEAVNEDETYRNYVLTKSNSDNFYKAIVEQCRYHIPNSNDYIENSARFVNDIALYTETLRNAATQRSQAVVHKEDCLELARHSVLEDEIEKGKINSERMIRSGEAEEAVQKFNLFYTSTIRNAKVQIDQIAATIIDAKDDENKENKIPVLEKYMILSTEQFMHPNAARYLLLNISNELKRKITEFQTPLEELEEDIKSKIGELKRYAAMDEAAEKKGLLSSLTDTKTIPYEPSEKCVKISGIIKELCDVAADTTRNDVDNSNLVDDYCYYLVNISVFEKLKHFIDSITEGFKEIYSMISSDISSIGNKISDIESKFINADGFPRLYVCSSAACLKRLNSECKNTIGIYDLPTELTREIYDKAKKFAVMKTDGSLAELFGVDDLSSDSTDEAREDRKNRLKVFFGNVFDDVIMNFWKDTVKKQNDEKLNLNAVQAIFKEALVEGCVDEKSKEAYLARIIEHAENLAIPFIDPPRGIQRREIRASSFNNDIVDKLSETAGDKFFEALGNFGAEISPDVNKYQILFYHSLYNIAAKNLVKMIPAESCSKNNTGNRFKGSGIYFSTYHERISNIEPLDTDNKEITPHIQKDWQYINVLPEVDEVFQKNEEIRIAKAFIYALVSGKIAYRRHDRKGFNFCYELVDSQLKSPRLIVSNGTNCDQFHEVLDALTICPRYVDRLLEMFDKEIADEKALGHAFRNSAMRELMLNFSAEEFSLKPFLDMFHIPLLYKASAGSNYFQAWGEALISATFEIIDDMITALDNKRFAEDEKTDFLIALFDDFTGALDKLESLADGDPDNKSVKRHHSRLKNISTDSITLGIYDMVADILEKEDAANAHGGQFTEKVNEIREARRVKSM